eukprot:GHVU01161075.1.p2 GENE.GHVU01161075.1~~GHVU01161075.1.p2  ORF type:complete len:129 (-),score=0.34 GHVU01161075.1:583-969(-)
MLHPAPRFPRSLASAPIHGPAARYDTWPPALLPTGCPLSLCSPPIVRAVPSRCYFYQRRPMLFIRTLQLSSSLSWQRAASAAAVHPLRPGQHTPRTRGSNPGASNPVHVHLPTGLACVPPLKERVLTE